MLIDDDLDALTTGAKLIALNDKTTQLVGTGRPERLRYTLRDVSETDFC